VVYVSSLFQWPNYGWWMDVVHYEKMMDEIHDDDVNNDVGDGNVG
jgi:hypothetical protein